MSKVNGTAAYMTNIIVGILAVVSIIGVVIITLYEQQTPEVLVMVLTACIGFLAGTNFTPIGEARSQRNEREKDSHINGNGSTR